MFDEKLKKYFLIHTNFLVMITISLFYCCEQMCNHMNVRIIAKNSIKHCDLKKVFRVT